MLDANSLAVIFIGLMGLSVILYAVLDGYDLGVGILLPLENDQHSDAMVASIGPFWDANETWLVLAVGLLLIAFPSAHSLIFRELYMPTAILLISLVLRGVAFDFRAKAPFSHKPTWNRVFKIGSLLAALSQGYMLGMYVMGFENSWLAYGFSLLSALGVAAAYSFIGACWLVMKTEGDLQKRAVNWAKYAIYLCIVGTLAVSLVNPWINPAVYERWLSSPNVYYLVPLPILCALLFSVNYWALDKLPSQSDRGCWLPFVAAVGIFLLCFAGLAISFFPYIVPGQLTIWEAAAAPESLTIILWGAIVVVPIIICYTAFAYRVFWGKVDELKYY